MIIARRVALLLSLLGLASGCSDDPEDDPVAEGTRSLEAPEDVAAPPADAERTASGLAWKTLVEGTGDRSPSLTDTVRVHYTGWQTDGHRFDSSRDGRGTPIEFAVTGVIAGWTEGLQLMVEGEEQRLWIPQDLAYRGNPDPRYPMGMLVFDVELLAIITP